MAEYKRKSGRSGRAASHMIALEPRMMFDGAAVATAAGMVSDHTVSLPDLVKLADSPADPGRDAVPPPAAVGAGPSPASAPIASVESPLPDRVSVTEATDRANNAANIASVSPPAAAADVPPPPAAVPAATSGAIGGRPAMSDLRDSPSGNAAPSPVTTDAGAGGPQAQAQVAPPVSTARPAGSVETPLPAQDRIGSAEAPAAPTSTAPESVQQPAGSTGETAAPAGTPLEVTSERPVDSALPETQSSPSDQAAPQYSGAPGHYHAPSSSEARPSDFGPSDFGPSETGPFDYRPSDTAPVLARPSDGGLYSSPEERFIGDGATPPQDVYIFIDTNVENYQQLVESWVGRGTIVLIDGGRDGIDQVRAALAGVRDLAAIHFVSHGEVGAFYLGTTRIDSAAVLSSLGGSLAAIGRTLAEDGDILIYGCDAGAGEQGQDLIDAIALTTGADVAASVDDTGAAGLGGDWDLESFNGVVTAAMLSADQYDDLLARTNSGAWTIGSTTASTTREGITTTVTFTGAGTSTFTGIANDTFNNINAFSNAAELQPSLAATWSSANTTDIGTITITFSQAVTNPIINIDRLGGSTGGSSNSALLTLLTAGATLTKTSGPGHFVVDSSARTITRQIGVVTAGIESSLTNATGSAAGSVQVTGTFTTLTFSVRMNPAAVAGAGDGFEIGLVIDAPPDAVNDALAATEDVTLNGSVFANNGSGADSDPRGDTFTVTAARNSANAVIPIGTATTLPSGATLTVRADGTYTYAQNGIYNSLKLGETRTETFTYTIRDANGGTDTATATITITGVNDAPVAVNDTASTNEDTPVTITVLANDTDIDGDTLTVTAASAANGTVVRNANGTITYTPRADYNGTDTITYTISDGKGGFSTATVTVTIAPIDDAPVNNVPGSQTSPEDTDLVFSTANGNAITVTDADGGTQIVTLSVTNGTLSLSRTTGLTFSAGDGTADGTMTFTGTLAAINAALEGMRYTPTADYNGPAQISMRTVTSPLPVATFVNGGFELPNGTTPGGPGIYFLPETQVPGWETDATDGIIEIWDSGFNGVSAFEGGQFAEINANQVAALFQNFTPGVGSNVSISFAHRGRVGVDVMRVVATDLGLDGIVGTADDKVLLNELFSDGTTWRSYTRLLTESATGNTIRFEFRAVSTANNIPSVGNFVDGISPLEGKADFKTIDINVTPVADIVADTATTNEDTPVSIALLANDNFENPGRTVTAINGTPVSAGSTVAVANGQVTINAAGVATFTPNRDYNGTTSFTYTVTSNGSTETATATVTVNPVNDAPVRVGTLPPRNNLDAATVSVATAGAFSDLDGDALTYSATGLPAGLTIDAATGVISGNINKAASQVNGGNYSIVVTARDPGGLSVTQTFTWTVTNPGPTAGNDTASTSEDTAVTIAVLANDIDPDGDTLTVTAASAANGTVVRNADGTITYTPRANFNGTDTITYTISDGQGGTATTTVTVTVVAVNDAPVAVGTLPARNSVDAQAGISVATAGAFSDPDGDALTYSVTGLPAGLSINATTGVISGTINNAASQVNGGNYQVKVTATDTSGATVTQTFAWTVTNPAPIANNESVTTNEDTPVTIAVLANDSDPDGDTLSVISAVASVGQAVINANNTITYTPPANYNGTATINYTISDGNGGTATATVTITVTAQPDAPVVTTPIPDRTANDSQTVSVSVAGAFTDADGDTLTYTAAGLPPGLSINTTTGVISGKITSNASQAAGGVYSVTVTATDPSGRSVTDTFTWTIANPAPTAGNDTATTNEDTPVTIAVLANDSDPDGDTLTVTAATAANGTVVINADGTLTYRPPANYGGTDTITYTISDGQGGTATATVTVTVIGVNDIPVATPLKDQVSRDGQAISIPTATAFSDADGDTLTYSVTGLPAGLTIDPATGVISGTIDRSASQIAGGNYTITVTANDGHGGTASSSFTWTVRNPAPVATDDRATVAEDGTVRISVLANDTDLDSDPLTVVSAMASNGRVVINADGTLQYTPNPDFNGTDTIIYTIVDNEGGRSTASVIVTVTPVNDAPTVSGLSNQSDNDGDTVDWSTAEAFSDRDGDALTYSATGLPPGLSIDQVTGRVTGTLPADASDGSPYVVTITARDPSGASVSTTFNWAVSNLGPTARDDSAVTREDTPVTIAVLANDTDPDGDALSVVSATTTDGTVTVNADGTLTFVPAPDFNGVATITYTIRDADGTRSSATVTVTVTPVNDAPDTVAIPNVTSQDSQDISLPLGDRFSDRDGDVLTYAVTGLPAGLTMDPATGLITGKLGSGASQPNGGVYTVTVTATDPGGLSASRTFTWTVTNPAPTAVNDVATVLEDMPTDIAVLGNDSDPDGDQLTVESARADNGTVTINADGTLRYVPNANFNGSDTITYIISDGNGGRSSAVVRVTVTPVNDAPVARDDTATTLEDTPVKITVLGNDTDVDRDPLAVTTASAVNGTVTINADGTINYVPNANFNGTDTITYTISDGKGGTATAIVTVTVTPVNDAPVAGNDTATTPEDTPVTVAVLANDSDPDGDPLTVTGASAVNGTVTVNADGTITYVPKANFNGTDTITYTVSDGNGGTTTATVTITVTSVNDAPQPIGTLPGRSDVDGAAISSVATAQGFSDVDGDTLTYSASGLPAGLTINSATGVISGTIDRNASQPNGGVYTVVVTARDPSGATATSTFSWVVTNPAPTAQNDNATTDEDTPVTIAVLANDTDPDRDDLTVTGATANNGTVTVNANGTITYVPKANFNGTDTITYTISDGNGGTAIATVTVTVNPVNDAPVVESPLPARTSSDGATVSIPVAGHFSDVDGDTLTYAVTGLPAGLSIDPATGVISGTIDHSASQVNGGSYSVTVTASDGHGGTVSSTFTFTVTNPAPTAVNDNASTAEDTPVTIAVLANDTDPDGDDLTVTAATAATAANGTVTINANGTLTYVPKANFNGTDTITYTISDGQGGTSTATVTVTVTPVNDAPVVTSPLPGQSGRDGQAGVSVPTASAFRDVDGDTLTYSATGLPAGLSINTTTGLITGTIDKDASQTTGGLYTVTVTASDGNGGTVSSTFSWAVTNPGPTATNDNVTVAEDTPVIIAVLANDVDPDGDTLTVVSASATNGTVQINDDGTLSYQANANFNGTDTITYRISDGQGGFATATVTVTVTPVNDAPVATTPITPQQGLDGQAVAGVATAQAFNDVDGDTLTYSATGLPAGLTINAATGVISGTINGSASQLGAGNYSVTVTATDASGASATQTFAWTVANPPPVAVNDSITVAEDTTVGIPVLANDSDPDGDPLTIVQASAGRGTVAIIGNVLRYTPPANFNGTDTISYRISDGQGGFATATVTVTVTAVNDAPVVTALPPRADVNSEVVTVPLGPAFRDVDGDTLTYSATGLPPGLTINPATGTVSGTIANNASIGGPTNNGVYQVTVTANDGHGGTVSSTFTWTITNTAPNPVDDTYTMAEDSGPVTLAVLVNDTDPNGNTLTVTEAVASSGTVTVNPDGTLAFTPLPDFHGTVTITYTVSDGLGGTATATATVTVTPVNDAPDATNPFPARNSNDSDAVNVALGGLFSDRDGDTLTFAATGLPAGLSIDPATGTITGTISSDASQLNGGGYSVTVTATDPGGLSVSRTFTWTVANPGPTAGDDNASTLEDTPVTVSPLGNDNDPDGDMLSIVSATALNGRVTINGDGTVTYIPAANFNGTDTITYTITDGQGGSATARITVTVTAVNDAPVVDAPLPAQTRSDGATVSIPVADHFSDIDGDTLTFTATGLPAGLSIDAATGLITGTIDRDASQLNGGVYTVTVTASDGKGGTVSNAFSFTVTNPGPTANNDNVTLAEDTSATIDVLTNDTDPDRDQLKVTEARAENGTVTINDDGTITYVPNANFNGSDTITYTITDGQGGFSTATVAVTVTAVNDAPVATQLPAQTDLDGDIVSVPVAGSFSDIDGDTLTFTATGLPAGLSIDTTTGVISGKIGPDASQVTGGVYSVTVTASDGRGGTVSTSFAWTVTNPGPTAGNDVASTAEDTLVTIAVLANDNDPDGDLLSITAVAAAHGRVTINADGTLTYVPNANFFGTDTITYTISDGQGGTATATVTVTVTPVNDPPVANNDSATTPEDTPVAIAVLDNDTDIDGDPLTISAISADNGVATVNADGTVTYVPNANFNGTDTITYTISDGHGGFSTATVTVTVTPVNDPPVANDDSATTPEDTPVTIGVLVNDTDLDGDSLTVTAVSANNGAVTINSDGTITYTPRANFNGTDTITYTISDGHGGTATAVVTVTVTPVNDPPVAADDAVGTLEDTPVTVAVLDNDTDVDGDTLSVVAASANNGEVTINADGTIAYTPNPNFSGTDTVTYTISDGKGGFSTATVTVTVTEVNDPPVATAVPAQSDQDGEAVSLPIAGNFSDADGDTLTFAATGLPAGLSIDAATGVITGTIDRDASQLNGGVYTVTVTASDGRGRTVSTSFTWTVTNPGPTANNDTAVTREDTPVTIAVLANDTDPDGDLLTVTNASAVNGQATINADGTITYVPNANFSGTDTITYTIDDGQGGTSTATVTVTVLEVNDPPVATALPAQSGSDGEAVSVPTAGSFSDVDGDTLTFAATGLPAGLSINRVTGLITGTIDAGASQVNGGVYTVTVIASDGRGGSVATTFTWTVTNPGPTAVNDNAVTREDTPVTIAVLANDTDPDGDPLTVTAVSAGNGRVTIDPDGTITYTPNPNFNGTDTITYTISDGNGGFSTATVTVTVTPVNDPPVAVDDAVGTLEDTPVTIPVLANDSDVDGDPLTITAVSAGNGQVTINADGTITYTPNPNFSGTDTITYTISDGKGGFSTATVTVTVTEVNDPPVVTAVPAQSDLDGKVVSLPIAGSFSDADGDPLTFAATGLPAGLSIDPATGLITGTIDRSASQLNGGVYTVTVTASDGRGGTVSTSFTWTVANPGPTAVNDNAVTNEDTPVTISVLANDTDPDGDPLTVTAVSAGNGQVTINADGTITYVPNPNFSGTDTITYTISDGQGGFSTATVTVTVIEVNDPPVATALPPQTDLDGKVVSVPTAGSFSDADGDPLTFAATGLPAGLSIDPATGLITGTIDRSASQLNGGVYTVTVTASDGRGGTVSTSFTWTVTNPGPTAVNDTAITREDTPVTIPVLANDTDPDGDPLTVTAASAGNGQVTINADGTITYVPNPNFFGTDTITYTISDGQGGFSTATVTVTVTEVNDPPVATALPPRTDLDGGVVSVPVAGNFSDADGDPLTFVATGLPAGLSINPATGLITGTIDRSASQLNGGVYTVTVTASDGRGGTVSTTFIWTVTNPGPTAVNDNAITREDTPVTIPVLANDRDPDGDPLTVTAARAGNGTVTINADGTITYVPNPNFFGTDTITYTISDGQGGFSTATVTVTVTEVNDPPIDGNEVIAAPPGGGPVTVAVLGNAFDPDGDPLKVIGATAPVGSVVINADGTITYTPPAGFGGTVVIEYVVSDGRGGTIRSTLTIDYAVPGADINALLDIGAMRWPAEPVDRNVQIGESFIHADPIVLQSVNEARSLNGTADLNVPHPVLEAVNGISWLRGTGEFDSNGHPVSEEVARLDRLRDLRFGFDRLFDQRFGDWFLETLTGFSARAVSGDERQVEVESVVRGRTIYIEMRDMGGDKTSPVAEFQLRLAGGEALPDWIRMDARGLAIIERPVDVDEVRLVVRAIREDGSVIDVPIVVQGQSGEIQLDKKIERRGPQVVLLRDAMMNANSVAAREAAALAAAFGQQG